MKNLYFIKEISFFFYKFRHIIVYTIIGFFSIICELIIRNFLLSFNLDLITCSIIGIVIGIFIAFYLNIKINFYIKDKVLPKALLYYFIISIISIIFQFYLSSYTKFEFYTFYKYEVERLVISAFVFIFSYLLHKSFSFKNSAKLGVAIYASKETDVHSIYQKIGIFPDFIHVDIVDKTFVSKAEPINFSKYKLIKKYWKKQEIHTHLMTKKPKNFIERVSKFSDLIFIHWEIDDNLNDVIEIIKKNHTKIGVVLHTVNNYDNLLEEITNKFSNIMVLCIPQAGFSGQKFDKKSYDLISKLNQIQKRKNINLFVDGGINNTNIKNINAENIISGSNVLNNKDPRKQIMILKTFGRYI